MDQRPEYFVPVILRRTYRRKSKRQNYVATVTLLAEEDGTIVAAGVGFQGYEYDNRKVTNSYKIGRDVALGRAVKALVEGQHNSLSLDCPQLDKLVQDIGVNLFMSHKGVAPEIYPPLPTPLKNMVEKAISNKMRLAVYPNKHWKFVDSREILNQK